MLLLLLSSFWWRWFISVDAGFTILRFRVQFLLTATRWICVGWSRRQLVHVLLYNQLVDLQPVGIFSKFLILFTIFVSSFIVCTISTRVLNTTALKSSFFLYLYIFYFIYSTKTCGLIYGEFLCHAFVPSLRNGKRWWPKNAYTHIVDRW